MKWQGMLNAKEERDLRDVTHISFSVVENLSQGNGTMRRTPGASLGVSPTHRKTI